MDELVLVLDPGLRVIDVNRGAAVLLGYSRAELLAMKLPALLDAGERERVATLCRLAKERRGGETVFLTRSRRRVSSRFSLSPFPGADGKPRNSLLVGHLSKEDPFSPDADSSNGLAARMLRGSADLTLIIDGASRIIRDCNDLALEVLGFTREELVGRRFSDIADRTEEHRRNRGLESRADKAYATAGIFQERILFPRKDAPALPCDVTGLPFFRPDGSLASIIAILSDRSAEEEREAELSHLIEQISGLSAELAAAAATYTTRGRKKNLAELGLTARQIEVIRLVAAGASSKDIGFRLGIAESTVKNHLAVVYRRLKVGSRIDLMRAIAAERIRIA